LYYRIIHTIFLLFLLSWLHSLSAQDNISFSAEGNSLDKVLEQIADKYRIKFAFDSDSFSKIEVNFRLKNATVRDFLELLNENYFVESEFIEGTWVLTCEKSGYIPSPEPSKPEPVIVTGYVKDKITGEDLVYCNVVWDTDKGSMTNELGFFSFEIPPDDSVNIIISHLGYERLDTTVSTGAGILFLLEPSDIMMDPVQVISYEKQILQAAPMPESIGFNPLKSLNFPRVSDDDLGNALILIPGVNFIYGGESGLSVRGSSPSDNLILFDGIPVLETSHLLGNMSVLNAKFVSQAFVSRGGFSAEFGDRVAGLIHLIGKSGKNNRPYVDLSANLLNYNVLTNIPITNKFSVTAAWRRSFIDRWQNYLYYRLIDDVAGNQEDQIRSTIIPTIKYQDINSKISFHPSENFELNINFLYGTDHQSRDFELVSTKDYYRNESVDGNTLGISINMDWQADSRWFHSFSAGFSGFERDVIDETGELQEVTEIIENPGQGVGKGKGLARTKERTYERLTYDIDNGFNSIGEYRVRWKTEYNPGIFSNSAGIGFTSDNYSYRFFAQRSLQEIGIDSIVDNATLQMANGFIEQRIDLSEWLNLRWGVRTNYNLKDKRLYFQPRGGVEVIPQKDFKLYLLSGIYYQFLNGIKRFDSEGHFNRIWYLPGEEGMGIAKGHHNILGAKYINNGWYIEIEAYLKNITGKVNLFAREVMSRDNPVIKYFPLESNERYRGVDIFLQKKHSYFNHMISYSLSKTEEQTENIMNDQWFPGYNDRLHRLKITEMFTWKNWHLTGSWHFAGGLPVIRFTDNQMEMNIERTDYFSQIDFALVRDFRTGNLLFNAGVSFLNVLDRKNIVDVNYLRFSSDTGSLTVRSDISALGFTPVFFMNLKIH
jgi:ferric enterobactin receptor